MANRSSSDLKHNKRFLSSLQQRPFALILRLLFCSYLACYAQWMGTALLASGQWVASRESRDACHLVDRDPLSHLSGEEIKQLAEQFAPKLLFHRDEQYFPCNPLFPIEGAFGSDATPLDRLGTAESRKERYLVLPLAEKAKRAKVYYRVRTLNDGMQTNLILDYWLYYVWNDYRVRGGLFPVWFDRSHPNDLEHIHLIVRAQTENPPDSDEPSSVTGYTLDAIYASAHEGTIPANRYFPSSSHSLSSGPHFLVELGAHASAPDIDKDGLFTPGVDASSGYKILWGIRDKGITWLRYNPSYSDPRSEGDSIVFSPGSAALNDDSSRRFIYQLVSVDKLAEEFNELEMTKQEREAAFETRIHWLKKVTGKSTGESGKLLNPPSPDIHSNPVGLNGFSSTERGIILGGTSLADSPGVFLGGRYGFLHGLKYLPDFIFEIDGILTTRAKSYLDTQFLLSYPVSVSAKVLGGIGILTDSIKFQNHQWDWIAGLEVRLGHILLYAGARSNGLVNSEVIDVRLAYFF